MEGDCKQTRFKAKNLPTLLLHADPDPTETCGVADRPAQSGTLHRRPALRVALLVAVRRREEAGTSCVFEAMKKAWGGSGGWGIFVGTSTIPSPENSSSVLAKIVQSKQSKHVRVFSSGTDHRLLRSLVNPGEEDILTVPNESLGNAYFLVPTMVNLHPMLAAARLDGRVTVSSVCAISAGAQTSSADDRSSLSEMLLPCAAATAACEKVGQNILLMIKPLVVPSWDKKYEIPS
uniref:Glucanase-like n=1 Tax=Oryza sativa subsp. japonica TaxID=39947 RepID=Q6K2G5_ORYSJ|nr:glucanase-like [Oryza sativa Japonica Group]